MRWRCLPLEGYASQVRRVNPQLGWSSGSIRAGCRKVGSRASFDDSSWAEPVSVRRPLGEFAPSRIAPVRSLDVTPRLIGKGVLAEVFGYPATIPGRVSSCAIWTTAAIRLRAFGGVTIWGASGSRDPACGWTCRGSGRRDRVFGVSQRRTGGPVDHAVGGRLVQPVPFRGREAASRHFPARA